MYLVRRCPFEERRARELVVRRSRRSRRQAAQGPADPARLRAGDAITHTIAPGRGVWIQTLRGQEDPFGGDVLLQTMQRLRESVARQPRRLRIVYALPKPNVDLMGDLDWLTKQQEIRTQDSDWMQLTVYEVRNA